MRVAHSVRSGGAVCGAVRGVRCGWYAEGGGRCTECSGRRAVCATGGGHHWHWQQNGRIPRHHRSKQPLPQHKQTHAAAAPQNTAATTIQTDAHCGGAANYYHYCAVNGLTLRQRRSKQPLPQHKRTHTAAAAQNTAVSASHTDAHGGTTADYYHYCAARGRTSRRCRSKQLPLWHKRTSLAAAPHTAAFGAPRSPRTHHRIIDICRHRVYNVAIQPARHGYAAPNNR